ncbi:NADH-quinone oxidoreductase subunit NuoG [Niveibacterium umoris]|uniref:NADH-quinone oxidoreductase n=1 Tax=Niveibacterium umoris TaxID=1193620 RepID=A0A840BFU9_9RHOO|nr:NADH-quinone oxidoreductase subunit NuoG [Niveibacterium umoris]MBB4012055.1 NADH-quinone oxidoreductase subunit G [Niveibacterium umoris]
MLEIEIDGKKVEVPDGSTVMDAANRVGTYIPHFCYHKKLSIAANCRMCLVEVEKAPKPLPACATPVTNGMKVTTNSTKAVKAQKAVMEFLLINHPLDCPICDQGGECQLQDLAVGYGESASRYQEEKRVVVNKDLGPLISTDMTRCIHCTRCVRFGQEVAGIMELGVANRGERSEIMAFVNQTVDSELSGNVIDLCPVGALTSKPFRFSARTWELSRRRSISPHDSLGANLVVQIKHDEVKRVLPLENDAVNECWISDKDRFSYEALTSPDRLTQPMVKQGGKWLPIAWQDAIDYAVRAFGGVVKEHGAESVGAFLSPHSTLEEMFLAQRIIRRLGSDNVDFRLRQSDFTADSMMRGVPWLGMNLGDIANLDQILLVGGSLRKESPLLAQRIRQVTKRGAQVSILASSIDAPLVPLLHTVRVGPDALLTAVAKLAVSIAHEKGVDPSAYANALAGAGVREEVAPLAKSLLSGSNSAIILGSSVTQHPQLGAIWAVLSEIERLGGVKFGFVGEAANSVGGYVANAMSRTSNTSTMLSSSLKALLLVGVEPALDFANGARAIEAMRSAKSVIALTAFRSAVEDVADLMLPLSTFAETAGTYVNCEGRAQSFNAAIKPRDEIRPGWKILRVLGAALGLDGFDMDTCEQVRDAVLQKEITAVTYSNSLDGTPDPVRLSGNGLQRVSDIPIYSADPIVRRARSLQRTRDAAPPTAKMSEKTLTRVGLRSGERVKVSTSTGAVLLTVELDSGLADDCVRIAASRPETFDLGPMFGELTVERA